MKYLVVGPSWVGDMVMAQSLFKTLKQQHPDCCIEVLAPAWSRPLLDRMPEVHTSINMPVGHGKLDLGMRRKVARELARYKYDEAILLPNSLKSALIPWLAGIPVRTGWRGEMRFGLLNDIRLLDKKRYPLMVERFVALGLPAQAKLPEQIPRPALQIAEDSLAAALETYHLETDRPVLALCPGAEFGPAKRWPEEYYAEVARVRAEAGWQVWLFGSEKDKPVAEYIRDSLPEDLQHLCVNLAGMTKLAEAVDLLSVADAVVSNDSGLMHIAAALERPLVVVYGSTSPEFTPPLNENKAIVSTGIECSPCFKRECPLGHLRCLKELMPEQVIEALDKLAPTTVKMAGTVE
ncbi:lipopolysaccharide heptosyltransferase II [Endozoicomonadaceae bacterium StTr2]